MSKRLNLGTVDGLWTEERDRPIPPATSPGVDVKKGGKLREIPSNNGEEGDFEPVCKRHPDITFQWDTSISRLRINILSKWGKRYWDQPCPPGSNLEKNLNRLWMQLNALAKMLFDSIKIADYSCDGSKLPEAYQEESRDANGEANDGSEPWDFLINRLLDEQIQGYHYEDSEIRKLLEKIDKYLEKHGASEDDEDSETEEAETS